MESTMQIRLHKQATTTPKVRAAIQASDEPARVLAQRHGTMACCVDGVRAESFPAVRGLNGLRQSSL